MGSCFIDLVTINIILQTDYKSNAAFRDYIVIQSFVIEAACEVLKHSPTFICTRTDKSLCVSACMTVVARIGPSSFWHGFNFKMYRSKTFVSVKKTRAVNFILY